LTQQLVQAFPETPPYGGQFGSDPTPHLTIARASTEGELDRLQAEVSARLEPLFPLDFEVRKICIEEEGPAGNWLVSATIPLLE